MPDPKRPLKVFLSYASQDKPLVRELSRRLVGEGWIDTWLDEKNLLPGQDWRVKIEEAVEDADVVIIVLSQHSVSKEGHVQKELRYAREIALEKPEDAIFLIPLRLDECEVPRGLRFYQWVDYFGDNKESSYKALVASLKLRYEQKIKGEEAERLRKEQQEREIAERIALEKAEKDAAEKARLKVEKEERQRSAKEKAEREAAEKLAREKAEKEAAEKVRLEAEALARQKSAKEKVERESAEKAWFDKTWAEAEERANQKAAKEKVERNSAEKAHLKLEEEKQERIAKEKADREPKIKESFPRKERQPNERPKRRGASVEKVNQVKKDIKPEIPNPNSGNQVVYWVGGMLLVLGIVFLSLLNTPSTSPRPTPQNTQSDILFTSIATKNIQPSKTLRPTSTLTPISATSDTVTPTPLLTEIIDDKGASMVFVPSGDFIMGGSDPYMAALPVRTIFLDEYYIDKYEVTNSNYSACIDDGTCSLPYYGHMAGDRVYFENPANSDYPVLQVTWKQADTYCKWREARLPTEAEWEKAARGTDGRTFPWGEQTNINCKYANINDTGTCALYPSQVGSYILDKSPYGANDMLGNAEEWVNDWYGDYDANSIINPKGPSNGTSHVIRGGTFWSGYGIGYSITMRFDSSGYSWGLGFRCAKNATP